MKQIKFYGFHTYENVRKDREGGGVALSVKKELSPAFVRDGGDEVEAVTVDIHMNKMAISVTSAYGPQENALIQNKTKFWEYLSKEAHRASTEGKGFILQGDLNAWLGPAMLPGDVNDQNRNGKLFSTFLAENKLTCVNTLRLTKGLITRSRNYLGEVKQSSIDFYVVCQRVLPFVTSMRINEDKKFTLTNYTLANSEKEAVNSDHAPLVMEVKLEAARNKKKKVEMLNFNDKLG